MRIACRKLTRKGDSSNRVPRYCNDALSLKKYAGTDEEESASDLEADVEVEASRWRLIAALPHYARTRQLRVTKYKMKNCWTKEKKHNTVGQFS